MEGCTLVLPDDYAWTDVPILPPCDWTFLDDAMSEEGQVVEKPKAKRVRSAAPKLPKGSGIGLAGKFIVCSYCGNAAPKALVPTAVITGAAFDTLPCALAWGEANGVDAAKLCALYGQPAGLALPAPDTAALIQFGGTLTQDVWLPNYDLWTQHTQLHGITSDALPKSGKSSKKKAAAGAITFEVGAYLVPLKGAAKLVDKLDADAKAGDVTIISAKRKLDKFAKTNLQQVQHWDLERFSISACGAGDATQLNNVATQLAGANVYGPAMVLFTRKCSIKV